MTDAAEKLLSVLPTVVTVSVAAKFIERQQKFLGGSRKMGSFRQAVRGR